MSYFPISNNTSGFIAFFFFKREEIGLDRGSDQEKKGKAKGRVGTKPLAAADRFLLHWFYGIQLEN